ncbi:MAG: GxxExxY protein [Saprospiraceae bacterium]|nr:GxxExxY protein [Saprospiraceae bacterium]
MKTSKTEINHLIYQIVGCAIEVHRHLGPGLLEKVYEKCLKHELESKGFKVMQQQLIPIEYKGVMIDADLRYDLLVEDLVVVEIKAVEMMHPIFDAQLLTYLKLLEKPKGLLINFNCTNLVKEGQKTMVTQLYTELPE